MSTSQVMYLIRYGEVALKGKNRRFFLGKLTSNIAGQLGHVRAEITLKSGRVYLKADPQDSPAVEAVLSRTMGVVGFSRAVETDKDMERIEEACGRLAEGLKASGRRFKIEARRTDKSFPLNSYGIACRLGDCLRARFPDLSVSLYDPDWILYVEIRDRAYLYGPGKRGPGGLPVGGSGKGLLLLSGGIDSPAAGYLMAKRGLRVDSVYFHTPPFTSDQALSKAQKLAEVIGAYQPVSYFTAVDFSPVQLRIKERAPEDTTTLMARACMVRIADLLAAGKRAACLITGESLGQVASQTVQSIAFTETGARLPVFRPLIGWDKEEIIALAKSIGTYEISILPYPDCCTLFAPARPITRPKMDEMEEVYGKLAIGELLENAARSAVRKPASGHR
jgi:thiamine biosynthesis protein ThiI